jgi:ribose 5-phosphate isomerase B
MKIYIGADHRGFELKNKTRDWLLEKYEVEDIGALEFDENDDYTLYGEKVGSLVADNKQSLGILLCGSGVGVNIISNKIDGVRAGIGINAEQVKIAREHDDMNVLVIASDYMDFNECKKMIGAFLEAKFDGAENHARRVEDIKRMEANN